MVTEGFYDRSRLALWLFEAIGREWDDMAAWARTLRNECLPQTCTWSIAIWEFVHGYEPDDALTLDYRRRRLLARRLSRPPVTPARMEAVLSAITGCPVHITENYAPYTFRVEVDESNGAAYDYKAAFKTLREIKPSHLSYRYEVLIVVEFEAEEYSAGATAECVREYLVGDDSELPTDSLDYSAEAAMDRTREYITGDEGLLRTDIEDYSASAAAMWTREYITGDESGILTEVIDCSAGAGMDRTREYITGDETLLLTQLTDYSASAAATWTREYIVGDENSPSTDAEDYSGGAAAADCVRETLTEEHPIADTATICDGGATAEYVKEERIE
jgi:hypothetical protein